MRALLAPTRPDIVACVLVAVLLLGGIVRSIGGEYAGAISLFLISFYPQLVGVSVSQAIRLLCLVSLVWLLVTRDWTRGRHRIACVALVVLVALGSLGGLSFLALSPVIALAWLLQRYVPADALRPYRTLWQAGAKAFRSLIIVACIASLLILLYGFTATDLPRAGNLFVRYLGFQSAPAVFSILVILGSSVSLWWLWISIQSGNGLAFSLTAIPIAYLAIGSFQLIPERFYPTPAHPILLANLIAFLGLWLRGRANKRVLDSTRN